MGLGRGRRPARITWDPWRSLAAAIVVQALKDARAQNGHSAAARWWLLSPGCANLLDLLGCDRGRLVAWVEGLEPLRQPALPGFEALSVHFGQMRPGAGDGTGLGAGEPKGALVW